MRLRIHNFAKVKEADIILDGITVIAGKNDTGKSTVGKVLDSMYNSMNHLEEKMKNARRSRLRGNFYRILEQTGRSFPVIRTEIVGDILEAESRDREIQLLERLTHYVIANAKDSEQERDELKDKLLNAIEEIKFIPDEVLTKAILTNYFNEVFNNNINNAEQPDIDAEIEIEIKSGKNTILFSNGACVDFKLGYKLTNTSFYLDNPMLIDKLNYPDIPALGGLRRYLSEQEYHLYVKLIGERSSAEDRAIEEIINREKLEEVIRLLDRVIPGEIIYNQKYEYKTEKGQNGIDIRSLSTGLKSFAILKQLILNGSLSDKDAVVLDEPEIHLHPEWQMVYAELIVVLQKKFDLNFIINTHSSHFLETLDFYAAKYGRKEACHYYLSEESEGMCTFEDVTAIPEKIYKQLVDPSLLLAREKEMWEDEHGAI